MQSTLLILISVFLLLTIQNPACGKVLQFTADGFAAAADTAIWNAVDGNSVMTSVHAATNGWSLAVKEGKTVFFDNGISSPLGFPDSATILGGAPATAAWAQSWSGGISELILLEEVPTEEQLNALRRYLALKHGLAVPTESDGAIVSMLTAMGIDTDGLFNSVFLVR